MIVRGIFLEAFDRLLGWIFAIEKRYVYSLDARDNRDRREILRLFDLTGGA